MANFSKFFPILMKHEGGSKFTNIPGDKGGATKWGIILDTWIKCGADKDCDGDIDVNDLKLSTEQDAMEVSKKIYWDKIKGDCIYSQSIAEFIFDWAYNSGVQTAAKKVQQLLGLQADGVIGDKTVKAINDANPKELFTKLKNRREEFYKAIVANNPSQAKFLKGWLNRNNSFNFVS